MAGYLSIPREKIDVVPLGINLEGFERRRDAPPDGRSRSDILRGSRPRKGLLGLCEAYVRFRQMPGVEQRAARSGRLSRAGSAELSEGCGAPADERRASAESFTYRGALDREQKIEFLQRPRRVLGADGVRRAEGAVSARGDGVRRAGRAAAARRVSRDAREDVGRDSRRAGRHAESRGRALQIVEGSGAARRARPERLRRRARALQHRPVGRSHARGVREVEC